MLCRTSISSRLHKIRMAMSVPIWHSWRPKLLCNAFVRRWMSSIWKMVYTCVCVCFWIFVDPFLKRSPLDEIDAEVLDAMAVTQDHFRFAIDNQNPSALRETVIVKWAKCFFFFFVKFLCFCRWWRFPTSRGPTLVVWRASNVSSKRWSTIRLNIPNCSKSLAWRFVCFFSCLVDSILKRNFIAFSRSVVLWSAWLRYDSIFVVMLVASF
jgi:hypothetical protein